MDLRCNFVAFSCALLMVSSGVCQEICGDESDHEVIQSEFGEWRCGLFVMSPRADKIQHVHTMQKLPGNNSKAQCAIHGILRNPEDWAALSEKCRKFMTQGLRGEFRLDKPLSNVLKASSNSSKTSPKDEGRTIGDELCTTVIKKHLCGFQYTFCLSVCGGDFLQTDHLGPEPICCKQVGKVDFKRVPCSEWRPFLEDRPVPEMCKDIVTPSVDIKK